MSLQYNVEVDGDYSIGVDDNEIALSGTVTVDTKDVLDQLEPDDVF